MKQLRNFIKLLIALALTDLSGMASAQTPQTLFDHTYTKKLH
jgi:hypothetical protein